MFFHFKNEFKEFDNYIQRAKIRFFFEPCKYSDKIVNFATKQAQKTRMFTLIDVHP